MKRKKKLELFDQRARWGKIAMQTSSSRIAFFFSFPIFFNSRINEKRAAREEIHQINNAIRNINLILK